jgi:putative ABC transport system permease protein
VINEGEATVVGVIEDFHNASLQYETFPCILMNWTLLQDHVYLKLNTSTARSSETLANIEKNWKSIYPDRVYKYSFLTDSMSREYTVENMVFNGVTLSAILSIAIGCLGLLGMVSFMALRKTKEIGIRKVLGAATLQIIGLFSKEFVWLVLIAFIVATPIAYLGMQQWLLGFASRIELSWWMFAVAGIAAQIIALVTILFQSIKAAMANPVDAIRNE